MSAGLPRILKTSTNGWRAPQRATPSAAIPRFKAPRAARPPTTHVATAPRQVWCWDMTYLPAQVLGRWFHLYLILDLTAARSWAGNGRLRPCRASGAPHGALREHRQARHQAGTAWRQRLHVEGNNRPGNAQLVGREAVVLAASDDNAYAEALFRTAKYRPEFLTKGFADLGQARSWGCRLRALVQPGPSTQWHPLRQSRAASRRRRSSHPGGSPRPVHPRPSPSPQPCAPVRTYSRLVTHRRRDPQPRTRLYGSDTFQGIKHTAADCMNEATTTLTRAGTVEPNPRESPHRWQAGDVVVARIEDSSGPEFAIIHV